MKPIATFFGQPEILMTFNVYKFEKKKGKALEYMPWAERAGEEGGGWEESAEWIWS